MNEMSRCRSCNEKFHPTIKLDSNRRFLKFDDMCKRCISLSYEEETYDEVFESVRVQDLDGLLELIHNILNKNEDY